MSRKKRSSAEARRILPLLDDTFAEKDLAKGEKGRPFLPGGGVDFNISHSGALAAVSLAKGRNLRTGCDIELIRRRPGAAEIAEEFFSAAEIKYLFPHDKFDEARFYEIWTLKECFLKLRGLSVFDMAAAPSFIGSEGSCKGQFFFEAAVATALSFRLYGLSGGGESYMLATAIEGPMQTQPAIRWFSQTSLACRMIAEIKAAPNPAETVRAKK